MHKLDDRNKVNVSLHLMRPIHLLYVIPALSLNRRVNFLKLQNLVPVIKSHLKIVYL